MVDHRYSTGSVCELGVKHDLDDFDCLIVAPFLLTLPCQKRKIPAASLKSISRKCAHQLSSALTSLASSGSNRKT